MVDGGLRAPLWFLNVTLEKAVADPVSYGLQD